MSSKRNVLVCGDSANDEFIISPIKLGNKFQLAVNIDAKPIKPASAQMLYNLLCSSCTRDYTKQYHLESKHHDGCPDLDTYIVRDTISSWIKKRIDDKTRLFRDKYMGAAYTTEKKRSTICSNTNYDIIAVCDLYNTEHELCTTALLQQTDTWKVVRTVCQIGMKKTVFVKKLWANKIFSKTIIILNARDLREAKNNESSILNGRSWEQLTAETISVVTKDDELKFFEYVIICFEHEGVLILHNGDEKYDRAPTYKLFYYPTEIEGDYVKQKGSHPFGLLLTFQAAITMTLKTALLSTPFVDPVIIGARIGLDAMRHLIDIGFEENGDYPNEFMCAFITDKICKATTMDPNPVPYSKSASYDVPNNNPNKFAIIKKKDKMLCYEIIKYGCEISKLQHVPILKYGDLIAIDKCEIEQYRQIYNLIDEYISQNEEDKPRSICVFGPPGSGKTFAVKKIIEYISGKNDFVKGIDFNISQMFQPSELSVAFNQIQDISEEGKLPIVFWDEFDSELNTVKAGWLRYFLAPMHDGIYYEKGHKHRIGRAVFIFAGGVYKSYKEFKNYCVTSEADKSKMPDFCDRVTDDGFVDIVAMSTNEQYSPRIAFFIRKLMEEKYGVSANQEFTLEDAVIDKLLDISSISASPGRRALKKHISKICPKKVDNVLVHRAVT
jgi:hypothetical protein